MVCDGASILKDPEEVLLENEVEPRKIAVVFFSGKSVFFKYTGLEAFMPDWGYCIASNIYLC